MPDTLTQLVRDTIDLTGAAPPRLMDADAPTLDVAADAGFYLVGLIGGKEVGKSAMVNALAGRDISPVTSHGAGTETVVAYVHKSRESAVKQLLDREAAGQCRIVTHDASDDPARVLLDLPDIDSHFESHLQLTRRMLRYMLFPVWIVSIEKYADIQPRQMLLRVAEGNDPTNFLFVLNKADQLANQSGAVDEIRQDYSKRIAAALEMDPPRVWVVSARQPESWDMPAFRASFKKARPASAVTSALTLAGDRRDRSLAVWLGNQDLAGRAERAGRLRQTADEMLSARVVAPLLERSLPRLAEDTAYRAALVDEAMNIRVARWPLVNLVHTLFAPLQSSIATVVRGGTARAAGNAEALVDTYLTVDSQPLPQTVASTFANLRQSSAQIADLYQTARPWEAPGATQLASRLRNNLVDTIEHQRADVIDRLARSRNPVAAVIRWTLTIGALIWFPFAQPLLQAALQDNWSVTTRQLTLLVVQLLGTTYLLTSGTFLVLYFITLWLALRWTTQRQVSRLLKRWSTGDAPAELSLTRQTLDWADEITSPLRLAHDKFAGLAIRYDTAIAAT